MTDMAMDTLGREARLRQMFLDGWRPYAWIVAAGLVLYFKTLSFGFCYFDDHDLIVANQAFLGDISNVLQAFFQKVYPKSLAIGYYRPILLVSFILDAQVGGPAPFVYHLTNIIIHACASVLVFRLFLAMGCARGVSFVFAFIFTVHPALSQAVAWVPGRNDSLLAAFVIASFICLLRFTRTGRARSYYGHLAFLSLGLFTKESAVVLIPLSYIYLMLTGGRNGAPKRWKALIPGHILVGSLWALSRHFAVKGSIPTDVTEIIGMVVPQIPAVAQLMGKAVLPFNQSVFPMMYDTASFYGLAVIAAIVTAFILCRDCDRGIMLFGVIWFISFLLPPLLRPYAPFTIEVLEHRLYLPIVGLMMAISGIGCVRMPSGALGRALAISAAAVAIIFSLKTFTHLDNFRDASAFWRSAAKTSPHSAFMHTKLGEIYYRSGDLDGATRHLEEAVRLDPASRFGAYYYLGHVYMKQLASAEAEKQFRKAIALTPDYEWSYISLGILLYDTGREEEAERIWRRCLEVNPENAEALKNLAIYCAQKKDFRSARDYADRLKAIGIEPPDRFLKEIAEGRGG
jgi:hypothetical protein